MTGFSAKYLMKSIILIVFRTCTLAAIVDEVYGGNSFTRIEGNTSNDNSGAVIKINRSVSQCRGFYRPAITPAKEGKDAYSRFRLTTPLMRGNDIEQWQQHMNYGAEYQGLEVDGYYI